MVYRLDKKQRSRGRHAAPPSPFHYGSPGSSHGPGHRAQGGERPADRQQPGPAAGPLPRLHEQPGRPRRHRDRTDGLAGRQATQPPPGQRRADAVAGEPAGPSLAPHERRGRHDHGALPRLRAHGARARRPDPAAWPGLDEQLPQHLVTVPGALAPGPGHAHDLGLDVEHQRRAREHLPPLRGTGGVQLHHHRKPRQRAW